ncbi:MAG TPA: DUF389 domain-containing protein, partial [Actinomycetota bacterium]|nr:DUF389 domain-containing protein [Actinomycetota bacterium]
MLSLRVAVPRERLSDITAILSSGDGIANVVDLGADLLSGDRVITAEVEPEAADALLKRLAAAGIATEDARLYELTETGAAGHPAKLVELADKDSLVWAAVEEQAHRVSTIRPSYIAYMVVAGIVAAIGILQKQSILIVGAMALSPDLGPVSAACVGVAGRNLRLLLKAALSLLAGLGSGAVGAACLTAAARGLGTLGDSFQLNEGGLGALATVNGWSAVVALAAGVA